ncbi:hypothetical protein QZH41_013648, partial [Actinostola sp. cb2023]
MFLLLARNMITSYHDDMNSQEVEQQLKKRNISKDKDVVELYLANRGLETVHDLNRFKNLQRIWLNGNEFRRLNCFRTNFQLTEVYLQNNLILEINGTLQHLRCLEVLMLNGNQLTKLTDVVHEFRAMQKLRDLKVLKSERDKAFKKYEPNRDMVKETISFGRRADGPPPKVYYPPSTAATVYHPEIEDS